MKRILSAICCLTLCCLPALAQKEHAAKRGVMADQDFINMAAQTDMMEAHLGQMAADQASSQDVKTYAQMLVTDHTADYQQIGTLAEKAGLTVPTGLDTAHNKIDVYKRQPRTPTVCETAAGFMITVMSRITLTATGMLAFASAKPPAVTCTS